MLSKAQAQQMLAEAQLIHDAVAVDAAIARVGQAVSRDLSDSFPLVLCVMNGGVFFCGKLLPALHFPLSLDYVHASRYGDAVSGKQLRWRVEPQAELIRDRHVLIVDDILDEGVTLATICERIHALGASSCRIAVLTEKDTGREKPVRADYVGLRVPNEFVFGCGLDAYGVWRNLPALYALRSNFDGKA